MKLDIIALIALFCSHFNSYWSFFYLIVTKTLILYEPSPLPPSLAIMFAYVWWKYYPVNVSAEAIRLFL